MSEENSTLLLRPANDDEVDLRELFLALWEKRLVVALFTCFTLALAATYAFVIAKPVFESTALLLPTQAPSTDQFGAAAALLGKKASGSADVDLYQSLLTSRTVMEKLLLAPMTNCSDTGNGRVEPLWKIMKLDTNMPIAVEGAVSGLSKSIGVNTKESGAGGILEIKFTAGTPWLAQEIGRVVLEIGQEELRSVRIKRAETTLPRLAAAVAQAKADWDSSARVVTWYRDRNRSIILPEQILDLSRLQMEQQVQEQKYLLARKEYEMQVLERAKAVPPMMIMDPANLPTHKSKPNRSMILALGLLGGLLVSCSGVLWWKNLAKESSRD